MTIIQKIATFTKKKLNFFSFINPKVLQVKEFSPFVLVTFFIFFSTLFFISSNLIQKKNNKDSDNLKEITKNTEFSNLTNYLISKINSPYEEINYVIKNNDTVEKILKKYKIRNEDIGEISVQLKERKLANIYSGRRLSLIFKKLENGTNTIVHLVYPINNITSVEIRKSQNNFEVRENILQLNKKEVVIKNVIKNNLYSSAVESGVEPNIIVEFARILDLKLIFSEILGKEIGLRFYMKNLKMMTIK